MRILSAEDIDAAAPVRDLLETLRRAYRSQTIVPAPSRLALQRPDGTGTLTLAPAWTDFSGQGHSDRGYIGCSLMLDLPAGTASSAASQAASPQAGAYLLFSGKTGQPIALLDGVRLAQRRRAALCGLSAQYLSREDSARLLVLSPPSFFPLIMQAYAAVRPIRSVLLEPTETEMCRRLSALPGLSHIDFRTSPELSSAATGADIICIGEAAQGGDLSWLPFTADDLPEGVHLDLLGGTPDLVRALNDSARIFQAEAPEDPAAAGWEITATFRELTRGEKAGRRFYGQTTVFHEGRMSGLGDFATAGHVFLRS